MGVIIVILFMALMFLTIILLNQKTDLDIEISMNDDLLNRLHQAHSRISDLQKENTKLKDELEKISTPVSKPRGRKPGSTNKKTTTKTKKENK